MSTAKEGLQGIEQAMDMFFGGKKRNLFESSKKLIAFSLSQLENNSYMVGKEYKEHENKLRETLIHMNSMNANEKKQFVRKEILGLD